jgi:hypothetical protein
VAALAALGVFAFGRASVGGDSPPSAPSPRSAIPGVGPTRTVQGTPAGYAHTRAGALAAALNYIGVVGNPSGLLDVGRLRQALAVVATPQLTRLVLAAYGQAADRLAHSPLVHSLRSGAPAIAMGVPVAYRVVQAHRASRQYQKPRSSSSAMVFRNASRRSASWPGVSLPTLAADVQRGERRRPDGLDRDAARSELSLLGGARSGVQRAGSCGPCCRR